MSHSEYAFAMCNRQRVAVVYSVYTLLRSFMYRFSLFQLSKRATNFTLLLLLSLSLSDIDPITRKQIRTARQAPSLCQAKAIHTHPPSLLSPTRHKQSNNDLTITCASECKRWRGDHSSLPGRFPILKKKDYSISFPPYQQQQQFQLEEDSCQRKYSRRVHSHVFSTVLLLDPTILLLLVSLRYVLCWPM